MLLGQLTQRVTIQGDIVLTLWKNGEVVNCDRIEGTEDLSIAPNMGLWNWMEIKYIFAAADGLHIDFEAEG